MHFFGDFKSFLEFGREDIERLHALHPLLAPHFEEISYFLVETLESQERTRVQFGDDFSKEQCREELHAVLEESFNGDFDRAYLERRKNLGLKFIETGLPPHFLVGGVHKLRVKIEEILDEIEELPIERRVAHESIQRVLDLDLTVILQAYWSSIMNQKLDMGASLATGFAHEIRNPLNAIGLNVTLLERRLQKQLDDGSDQYSPILEAIRSEVDRISSLTNELRDFAQPLSLNEQWHDTAAFLEHIERTHGPTLEASDISLETRAIGEDEFHCDADRLEQALVNLLHNAVEAIEDSGHITLQIENSKTGTTIELEDDGHGMEANAKYQIFELFYTTKASGTGIGLPIVKKIIEAHSGSIDVRSQPGEGTLIEIVLPRPSHVAQTVSELDERR